MMMKLGAFLATVALAQDTFDAQPLENVVLESYLGRWYQTHASATVKYTFELGGNCVTADYGLPEGDVENVITVTNEGRPNWWVPRFLRSFFKIEGFAARGGENYPDGALSVQFFGGDDPAEAEFSAPGNYWIFKLGPINEDTQKYEYSLVTNAEKNQLYVLVRDVARFRELYEEDVLNTVEQYGFTKFWNKPLETNQDGCTYD